MAKHTNHPARPGRRLEAFLDYALAVAIGVGLAWLLVTWWSS